MRVMVLYEPGRSGAAAIDRGRALVDGTDASLTVVGIAPQAEGGPPRCGGSAHDLNITLVEQTADELYEARRRLGELGDTVRFELLVEGEDPPLEQYTAREQFDAILLPARRRPLNRTKHPQAAVLRRVTAADVQIIDARDGGAARS